jgi:hypothetical protein
MESLLEIVGAFSALDTAQSPGANFTKIDTSVAAA